MQSVIPVYKPIGITPLQALDKLRSDIPELANEKLAYAGRLDPMAEGLLLVLVGDECKKREQYQLLPKTYTLSILFGFETDSYDLLGMITRKSTLSEEKMQSALSQTLTDFLGTHEQEYPPYSSARVNGKPLFYWARKNLLHTITIPTKSITIASISEIDQKKISAPTLLQTIKQRVTQVSGDFRQEIILKRWGQELQNLQDYPLVSVSITASSGSYMRSIAHTLGKKLNTSACAFSIKRTRIGDFSLPDVHYFTD